MADKLVQIMDELADLQKRAEKGEVTRLDLVLSASRMHQMAASSLMLLIQQGAPVHPSRLMK